MAEIAGVRFSSPRDAREPHWRSIGAPVGLGSYYAWLQRDYSHARRVAGLAAVAVGALAGAWFGFAALSGLGAILTTTAGAAAGANLALIGFDVSASESSSRESAGTLVAAVAE